MKLIIAVVVLLLVAVAKPAWSQEDHKPQPLPERPIVVGTIAAPPFAMRSRDGTWTGISIELWDRIARQAKLQYRFEERDSLDDLLRAVGTGEIDVAAAAVTITPERQEILAFSVPFYSTGLGVAVPIDTTRSRLPLLDRLSALNLNSTALTLSGLALALLIMMVGVEHIGNRRRQTSSQSNFWLGNTDHRSSRILHPQTIAGRALGMMFVIASCLALVTWAANYATRADQSFTIVDSIDDLERAKIGVEARSAAVNYLNQQGLRHTSFPDLTAGLLALRDKKIDALVADKPVLAWMVLQQFSASLDVLDETLVEEPYGFALRKDDPHLAQINAELRKILATEWWRATLSRYLGQPS